MRRVFLRAFGQPPQAMAAQERVDRRGGYCVALKAS